MRRATELLFLAALVGASVAGPRPLRAEGERKHFDHALHSAFTSACNDCHRLSSAQNWAQAEKIGKKPATHAACNAAKCHARDFAAFRPGKPDAFCMTCHVDRPSGPLAFPPFRTRPKSDFWLASFDHEVHMRPGNQACERCHSTGSEAIGRREMKSPGHEVCAGCHDGRAQPDMKSCEACHALHKDRTIDPPASAVRDDYRVSFTHAGHASRSHANDCARCHANAAVHAGTRVPLPAMKDCEGCHDGTAAFSALGTHCRKCHIRAGGNSDAFAR